jgi:hypothetical protein
MEVTRRILRAREIAVTSCKQSDSRRLPTGVMIEALAWSLAGALVLSSAWLLVRRLTGALAAPLDGGILVTVGLCAVLCAATARLLWRGAADGTTDAARRARDWLPTVALVFLATSASVPGTSVAAVVLLWSMLAAEEIAAARLVRRPIGPTGQGSIAAKHRRRGGARTTAPRREKGALDGATIGRDVLQHYTRERASDGREHVHGTLRADFVAGQRTAIEHLVFCPSLASVPMVTVEAVDELECSARATHVYRYGARLEIRLSEPCDEPVEVLVRYEARG